MESPPLAELYDGLRQEGLAIGIDDHIRIGRLLACEAEWTLETLRISIAALVVTHPDEQVVFDRCWQRWVSSNAVEPQPPVAMVASTSPQSADAGTSALHHAG